jgi:hypothetical protein
VAGVINGNGNVFVNNGGGSVTITRRDLGADGVNLVVTGGGGSVALTGAGGRSVHVGGVAVHGGHPGPRRGDPLLGPAAVSIIGHGNVVVNGGSVTIARVDALPTAGGRSVHVGGLAVHGGQPGPRRGDPLLGPAAVSMVGHGNVVVNGGSVTIALVGALPTAGVQSGRGEQPPRGGAQPARGGGQPPRGGAHPARGGGQPVRGGAHGGSQTVRGGAEARRGAQAVRGGHLVDGCAKADGGSQLVRGGAEPHEHEQAAVRGVVALRGGPSSRRCMCTIL